MSFSPRYFWLLVPCIVMSIQLSAQQQESSNPFELVYRMDVPAASEKLPPEKSIDPPGKVRPDADTFSVEHFEKEESEPDTLKKSTDRKSTPAFSPVPPDPTTDSAGKMEGGHIPLIEKLTPAASSRSLEQSRTLLFIFFVIQLIFLTLAVSLERDEVNRLLRALANDNYLNLIHRDLRGQFPLQYILFYLIFVSQLSLFIWLGFQHRFFENGYLSYWFCFPAISAIYLVRHTVMKSIAYIFPFDREANQFNFTIAVFNMVLGLFLLPVNAFIAFAASSVAVFCIYLGLFLIAGFYILRQLRGLFIARNQIMFHNFHFFLYLCTVEIAPIVVVIKFFYIL